MAILNKNWVKFVKVLTETGYNRDYVAQDYKKIVTKKKVQHLYQKGLQNIGKYLFKFFFLYFFVRVNILIIKSGGLADGWKTKLKTLASKNKYKNLKNFTEFLSKSSIFSVLNLDLKQLYKTVLLVINLSIKKNYNEIIKFFNKELSDLNRLVLKGFNLKYSGKTSWKALSRKKKKIYFEGLYKKMNLSLLNEANQKDIRTISGSTSVKYCVYY